MNDYIDVNIFLSVTDALFHGKVLYRDIFEHKGPFLYFIYSLIHILGNSYFTIYLFECVTNALFVYFGTKTILLYDEDAGRIRAFLYALCLEFCLCTSTTFMFGGVPEELFLWMSSYGLYTTLRCLKRGEYYSHKELVLIGLLCGAIFWTKYAMLGFYSGLVIYVVGWNIAQKNLPRLGKTILWFLGGFAISSLPTVIYCAITHSFSDMINVYFIGNIFGEHVIPSKLGHFYTLLLIAYKDIANLILIVLGIGLIFKEKITYIKILILITFATTFLASCCLKVIFYYYPLPLLAFVPLGFVTYKQSQLQNTTKALLIIIAFIIHFFVSEACFTYSIMLGDKINPRWLIENAKILSKFILIFLVLTIGIKCVNIQLNGRKEILLWVVLLLVCTLSGYGVRDSFYFSKSPLPQVRFAKSISQIPNANILVYQNYDFGFFKSSQTYPKVKYFSKLNLVTPDVENQQLKCIKNEIVDYIITSRESETMMNILDGTSYQLIDTSENYYYNGNTLTFFLYKKI